ncbi:MAG: hypothetical protein ACKOC5_06830, partial [Chloroflexota bacterium]
MAKRKSAAWKTIQQEAERARLGAEHARAVEAYTQALAQAGVPWEAVQAMQLGLAESRQRLGDAAGAQAVWADLAAQAAGRGDAAGQARAQCCLALHLWERGDLARGLDCSRQAAEAAAVCGSPALQVRARSALGLLLAEQGELEAAQAQVQAAEA